MGQPREFKPTTKPKNQAPAARSRRAETKRDISLGGSVKSVRQIAVIAKVRNHRTVSLESLSKAFLDRFFQAAANQFVQGTGDVGLVWDTFAGRTLLNPLQIS